MGISKKDLGRDSVQSEKGLKGMKSTAPKAKEVSPERASVTATLKYWRFRSRPGRRSLLDGIPPRWRKDSHGAMEFGGRGI